MGLFKKLFGRKAAVDAAPPVPADAATDKDMIRVFDAYGREMRIPREDWKTKVLPANLQNAWQEPEALHSLIAQSLEDGFFAEMLTPAEQLCRIDPIPARAATTLGIVYMNIGRLQDAQRVLAEHLRKHGDDGYVLTNLAKVYDAQKDHEQSAATLWHALEVDPNQQHGMNWHLARQRERGGEQAWRESALSVARLPHSWRAQLWLARDALEHKQLPDALRWYQESLSRAGRPVPTDLLMQMSGDLGNQGRLSELVSLTATHFDAKEHGLIVGNNLLKAYLELEDRDEARRILDQLFAQQRPDWQQTLHFWDGEIAKAATHYGPLENPAPLGMAMLAIRGPLWARQSTPAAELLPDKSEDAPVICFLGSSAETGRSTTLIEVQQSDTPGRLSRALPLLLAEQIHLETDAVGVALVPWIVQGGSGFVLLSSPWSADDAAAHALQTEPPGDYIVTAHLNAADDPWRLELRLVRAINAECLGSLEASFPMATPEPALLELIQQCFELLRDQAHTAMVPRPACYRLPRGNLFPLYLLRLEQTLAVSASGLDNVSNRFLTGEREIVTGAIDLSLSDPKNPTPRLLLAEILRQLSKTRPHIVAEYAQRIALLQKEHPLPPPEGDLVQRLIQEATAGKKDE